MLYTIFADNMLLCVTVSTAFSRSVVEVYRLHMFHYIESHWVIKAISETRGNADWTFASIKLRNKFNDFPFSFSFFGTLCAARDDKNPRDKSMSINRCREQYDFWRVNVMNKYNIVRHVSLIAMTKGRKYKRLSNNDNGVSIF